MQFKYRVHSKRDIFKVSLHPLSNKKEKSNIQGMSYNKNNACRTLGPPR